MSGPAYKSTVAPVSLNAADPVDLLNDVSAPN